MESVISWFWMKKNLDDGVFTGFLQNSYMRMTLGQPQKRIFGLKSVRGEER
jgi:hypothetical protein